MKRFLRNAIGSLILNALIVYSLLYLGSLEAKTVQPDSQQNGSVECFNSATGQITTESSMKACNQIIKD